MTQLPEHKNKSLKKEMIHLLDQFLLGYISVKELRNSTVPMLMVSANKQGRKNYIEKYLLDIAGKTDEELTRDYIYGVRENIAGEQVTTSKNRKLLLRRALRKLIERYLFDEIDKEYFVSTLFELALDYHEQVNTENEIKNYIDAVQQYAHRLSTPSIPASADSAESLLISLTENFYETYYKGLWDD